MLYAYIFVAWALLIAADGLGDRETRRTEDAAPMLQGWVIVVASFAYLGLLFAIAYYADKRADAGRSVIANPYIYSLSLAVYATAWTFYGSVGRAASDGVGFLPIYIGPTLMIALWWVVMRKIIRISKAEPHHLARRLHRLALRQERAARRPGHGHRGGRHRALHLAAAEGGVEQLPRSCCSIPRS